HAAIDDTINFFDVMLNPMAECKPLSTAIPWLGCSALERQFAPKSDGIE
ncbi:MAG: hypothetical protein ACI9WS_003430, partial [Paraglaciecola psychrophila]